MVLLEEARDDLRVDFGILPRGGRSTLGHPDDVEPREAPQLAAPPRTPTVTVQRPPSLVRHLRGVRV